MNNLKDFKQTKIVATIGPSCDTPEMVRELIEAGVNVFRFNMKHADIAWHHDHINMVQKVADKMKVNIGILIDLQGPEIRLETRDHNDVKIKKGEKVIIAETLKDSEVNMCIPHDVFFQSLKKGDQVLVDDGFVEFKVIEVRSHSVVLESFDDCVVKHRKGVNLPGKKIDLPSLIADDLKKLDMAGKTKVDFVALSFSRTIKDIKVLRREMKKRNVNAMVCIKTESQEAIDNIDELIEGTDALMVARGDLGIEVPIEQLAHWQKYMIEKCRLLGKPVITATQMLQSMVDNPRPTRAEACDVANAIFDGTDAIMLSGETASGKYPVKAVEHMARIAKFTESKTDPVKIDTKTKDITELITHSAIHMIDEPCHPQVDVIIVFTESGRTARLISSSRPKMPIIAVSRDQQTVEKMTLSYGIFPVCFDYTKDDTVLPKKTIVELKKLGYLEKGQKAMIIRGMLWGESGHTNTISYVVVE